MAIPWAQVSRIAAKLFGFSAGNRVSRGVSKVVHPLVTCTAVAMATAAAIGKDFGLGFADTLRTASCRFVRGRCERRILWLGTRNADVPVLLEIAVSNHV